MVRRVVGIFCHACVPFCGVDVMQFPSTFCPRVSSFESSAVGLVWSVITLCYLSVNKDVYITLAKQLGGKSSSKTKCNELRFSRLTPCLNTVLILHFDVIMLFVVTLSVLNTLSNSVGRALGLRQLCTSRLKG